THNLKAKGKTETEAFRQAIAGQDFDYVLLFDSSGMYKGEEIVNIASLLTNPRLDAVWGSRRLSVKDIHESYKLRYRHNTVLGAISYFGSHLLSLAYLLRYGRYLSDTLSAARAVLTFLLRACLQDVQLDVNESSFNQKLLCLLLEDQAEVIETPVQFFPLSPDKVRRTTVVEGLRSLVTVLRGWAKSRQRRNTLECGDRDTAGELPMVRNPER
ncbi:MAG: hypothetical protein ACRD82_19010, partial [Blastocatellia bacterium]